MKKILFIDKLDFFTFLFTFFFRIFFNKIVFRNASSFFKNFNVHKYLKLIGIEWVSFYNLDYKIYSHSYNIRIELENKFINNQVKENFLVKNFINEYKLTSRQIEKLYLCFRHNLYLKDDENSEASSIVLINKFFPKEKFNVYFVPYNTQCYLLFKEIKQRNIKVIGIHVLINNLTYLVKKIYELFLTLFRKTWFSKKNKKRNESAAKKKEMYDSAIAFFPHISLKYGDFFKKTYLYENSKESPLFKEKILTLFWDEIDKTSRRYCNRYRIPNANIFRLIDKQSLLLKIFSFALSLISLKNLHILMSAHKFFFFALFIKFKFRFILYLNVLNKLNFLKVVYVHYDTLFPQSFNLACDIKNITTISSQERPLLSIVSGPLCYNKYLISGSGFKDILKQKGYICDNYIDCGLPRSSYINNFKNLEIKKVNKYNIIRKTKKIVACFGLVSVDHFFVGLTGESGISYRSNVNFVKSILNLSKNFKDLYFVLRFKDYKTIKIIPSEIVLEIKETKNMEINIDLKAINSYDLLKVSDIVIGKPSTIMEEAMAAGKEVIIYDDDNYLRSINYVFGELEIIQKDYKSLEKRTKDIVEGKYDPSNKIKRLVNKYFCNSSGDNGFDLIKKTIKQSLVH